VPAENFHDELERRSRKRNRGLLGVFVLITLAIDALYSVGALNVVTSAIGLVAMWFLLMSIEWDQVLKW
jgi:hypothetical protein